LSLFGLFCAFKTSTTDLVHFYDIITAVNVGTTIPLKAFKDVGDDNWALFYTFSSGFSEKPGFRNNYFLFQIRSTTLKKGASTIQSI
jgi:hypothetical protein